MIELQNVSWKVDQFALKDVSCVIPDGKYAVLMEQQDVERPRCWRSSVAYAEQT